ncbi:UNVERIFIED_ORG: hypothetical protein OKW25_004863 [Pseudomonas vranovensis]|nr:hypothetical protein [Pseudomonas vranovensis]
MLSMRQASEVPPLPDFQQLPGPVYRRMFAIPAGHRVQMHSHPWVQFTYASAGIMQVLTEHHSYLLPPQCALWIPAGVEHTAYSDQAIEFRGLYLDDSLLNGYQRPCGVLQVTPLVRELIAKASRFAPEYPAQGAQARLLQVLVDELRELPEAPFGLPLPSDPRLRRITEALQATPADNRSIEDWAQQVVGFTAYPGAIVPGADAVVVQGMATAPAPACGVAAAGPGNECHGAGQRVGLRLGVGVYCLVSAALWCDARTNAPASVMAW